MDPMHSPASDPFLREEVKARQYCIFVMAGVH